MKVLINELSRNLPTVIGVVLVWRGVWYLLDAFDKHFFGDSHGWTAIVGVVIGLVLLYLPDRDLKEIGKM